MDSGAQFPGAAEPHLPCIYKVGTAFVTSLAPACGPLWCLGRDAAAIQGSRQNPAELYTLKFCRGGVGQRRIPADQRRERLFRGIGLLLQEAVKVKESVLVVSEPQRLHTLDMLTYHRSQVATVSRRWLQGLQGFLWPRHRHGPQNGGR